MEYGLLNILREEYLSLLKWLNVYSHITKLFLLNITLDYNVTLKYNKIFFYGCYMNADAKQDKHKIMKTSITGWDKPFEFVKILFRAIVGFSTAKKITSLSP